MEKTSQQKTFSPAVKEDEYEISLLDLAAVLWKRKIIVIGVTALSIVSVLVFAIGSILLPPEIGRAHV